MSDTPTLEEAFDEAEAHLQNESESEQSPKPEPEDKQTPEKEEAPKEDGKDKSNDENESEDKSEADFLKVDGDVTKMTPEQLLEIKKNWERAYTKKRQQERKELEEYRKKLEELEAQRSQPQQHKPVEEMTPQEYADYVANLARESAEVARYDAYIEAQEKAFYELDPRLNQDNPEFDQDVYDLVTYRLANARDEFEKTGRPITEFDFIGTAKKYLSEYDSKLQQLQRKYLKKQSEIARTKTEDFAKENPKTSGAKPKKTKMSLDEAVEAALKG